MPHSIFLGSALSTQDRVSKPDKLARIETVGSGTTVAVPRFTFSSLHPAALLYRLKKGFTDTFRVARIEQSGSEPRTHAERENNAYAHVRAHIYHGMIDITLSLLGLAVVINAM
jgi:metal iron transporter